MLVQYVVVTLDRRRVAADIGARFGGLPADAVLESPFVLIGTPGEMAEALRERYHRFGVGYWTVFATRARSEQTLETLAPVIARLR